MGAFGIDSDRICACVYEPGITKHDALDQLVDLIADRNSVTNPEALRRALYEREAIMSTGIGSGVAIPHVRIDEVKWPTIGIGVSPSGVDFGTLDDLPVNIIVLFAMPAGTHKEYLGLLAQVMAALKEPGFREKLLACRTAEEIPAVLSEPVD